MKNSGKTFMTGNTKAGSFVSKDAKHAAPKVTMPGHGAYVRSEDTGFASGGKTVAKPARVVSKGPVKATHSKYPS